MSAFGGKADMAQREKTSPVTKINGKAFYDGFINSRNWCPLYP
jgi:hypothetical protein